LGRRPLDVGSWRLEVDFGRTSLPAVRIIANDRRKPLDIVAGFSEHAARDSHPHVAFNATTWRTPHSYHQLRVRAGSAEQAIRAETALEAVARWTERKAPPPLQESFDLGLHAGCGVGARCHSCQPNQRLERNDMLETAEHRRPQPQATADQDDVHRSDLRGVVAE
jgi:hypothetical protein